MITKRGSIICDECGKFSSYYDQWTPFGCADPEYPEPYEPSHICKRCFTAVKKRWIDSFKSGYRNGDYGKSMAEQEAAEETGLTWVGSNGVGKYGTPEYINFRYVSKDDPRLIPPR